MPPADVVRHDERRSLSRRRRRQGHGDLLRHRQRHRRRVAASGWAMRSPRAARPATTTRRWASPRGRVGSGEAPFPRDGQRHPERRISPSSASATCRATCSATACCCRSRSGCWPRSTTATSSSIPIRTPAGDLAERKRLFDLPRSSWDDYDKKLISQGRRHLRAHAEGRSPLTPEDAGADRHRQGRRDAARR